MLKKLGMTLVATFAVCALGFGVNEAFAASNVVIFSGCPIDPVYNWCAPSEGGQSNCTACCIQYHYDGGICLIEDEGGIQGCLSFTA